MVKLMRGGLLGKIKSEMWTDWKKHLSKCKDCKESIQDAVDCGYTEK